MPLFRVVEKCLSEVFLTFEIEAADEDEALRIHAEDPPEEVGFEAGDVRETLSVEVELLSPQPEENP